MLKNYVKLQIIIIFLWVILYSLNHSFDDLFGHVSYISYIFIPAGLKIMFACLYGYRIFLGFFIGAILTGLLYLDNDSLKYLYIFSFFAAAIPVITVYLVNMISPIGGKLEYLNLNKVLLIAFLYALLSSFFHNTYLLTIDAISIHQYKMDSLVMFTGDLIGCLIFLSTLSYFKKSFVSFFNKHLSDI
tara:strand:+ start:587 stop:1150 length:564 start_codon:yes stop_codon:yes gene_type:complete